MDAYSITWAVIHVVAFAICVLVNGLIGANYFARFPGSPWQATVGDVAAEYYILIQPYTTAFSIWAVIFSLQGLLVILGALVACGCIAHSPKFKQIIQSSGFRWSFLAVQLLNTAWILIWCTNTDWGVTVCLPIIYLLLISLVYAYSTVIHQDRHIRVDGSPDSPIFFNPDPNLTLWENIALRYGWSIYLAWVTGASVLGTSVVLKYIIGLDNESIEQEANMAAITLFLVGIVFAYILYNTRDYVIGIVYLWTSIWIAVEADNKDHDEPVLIAALTAPAAVLLLFALLHLWRYFRKGCGCSCAVYTCGREDIYD